MAKIPLKKHWVKTDAWRGYYEYDNSVFGGSLLAGDVLHNNIERKLIRDAKEVLMKNKIPFRVLRAGTSNVFSQVYDVVVEKKNVDKAKKLLKGVV
jgi:CRISPR/Cas system-associated endoribonuclease Cas2